MGTVAKSAVETPELNLKDLDLNRIRIYQVTGENVQPTLHLTYRFIKQIVEDHGCYTQDDIGMAILNSQMQMFCGFIGVDQRACMLVITQFQQFPRKRVLFIQYMGGRDMADWQEDAIEFFETWARDRNIDELWAFGRKGLIKMYKDEATSYVLLSRTIT